MEHQDLWETMDKQALQEIKEYLDQLVQLVKRVNRVNKDLRVNQVNRVSLASRVRSDHWGLLVNQAPRDQLEILDPPDQMDSRAQMGSRGARAHLEPLGQRGFKAVLVQWVLLETMVSLEMLGHRDKLEHQDSRDSQVP
jgi:hypothetical protein